MEKMDERNIEGNGFKGHLKRNGYVVWCRERRVVRKMRSNRRER